jgi:hypothetical protein
MPKEYEDKDVTCGYCGQTCDKHKDGCVLKAEETKNLFKTDYSEIKDILRAKPLLHIMGGKK